MPTSLCAEDWPEARHDNRRSVQLISRKQVNPPPGLSQRQNIRWLLTAVRRRRRRRENLLSQPAKLSVAVLGSRSDFYVSGSN